MSRKELRFVFDTSVRGDDMRAKQDALDHLRQMKNPAQWIKEQIAFDADLNKAKKLSDDTTKHRFVRWLALQNEIAR